MEIFKSWLRVLVFGNKTSDGHRFGAIDVPDKRDFVAGIPRNVSLPDKIDLWEKSKLSTYNQGTCGSCTAYCITAVKQVPDSVQKKDAFILDPEKQWDRQELTGGSCAQGDWLQNALKRGMEYWEDMGVQATEYRVIRERDPNILRRWLVKGFPIFTAVYIKKDGSADNFAWSRYNEGVVDLEKGYTVGGHSVPIVGYETIDNVEYFIFQNSWGDWGFWENGKFLVRADQIHMCQSMYLIFDTID